MIQEAITKVVEGNDLTMKEAELVMNEIMSGECTDAQIAGFLVGLRLKKETIDEIAACAKIMRQKSNSIEPKVKMLVDTCGTGGDKSNTFNISTTAGFVVAGAGVSVAKHGNKSVSSKSGSADVLAALGVNIDLEPKQVEECIDKVGIGFMFAPRFHPAMKYAIGPRKELGIRTIFNILGPLTNPANAQSQVMGVFDPDLTEQLAEVLAKLGVKHALVVNGEGLDEITVTGKTKVSELHDGKVTTYHVDPTDYDMKISKLGDLVGGGAEENAQITLDILNGKERGPKRDITLLNAAAAIVASGKATDLREGINIAETSIDSGNALNKLSELKQVSNSF